MNLSNTTLNLLLAALFLTTGCTTITEHGVSRTETVAPAANFPATTVATADQATTSEAAPQSLPFGDTAEQGERAACVRANGKWLETDICELQFPQPTDASNVESEQPKKPACEGFGDCAAQVLLGVAYSALMLPLMVLMVLGGGG